MDGIADVGIVVGGDPVCYPIFSHGWQCLL